MLKFLGGASLPGLREAAQMLGSAALKALLHPESGRSRVCSSEDQDFIRQALQALMLSIRPLRAMLGFPQPGGLK